MSQPELPPNNVRCDSYPWLSPRSRVASNPAHRPLFVDDRAEQAISGTESPSAESSGYGEGSRCGEPKSSLPHRHNKFLRGEPNQYLDNSTHKLSDMSSTDLTDALLVRGQYNL